MIFMKKLFAILFMATILCSCSQTVPTTVTRSGPPEDIITPEATFYAEITSSKTRPIAVMIDNDEESARPQAGLENAYLVYEITVEGAATRLMALFKNYDIAKVGPVRSARHYFLDYALENDAIYVHAGQSPQAGRDIAALGMIDINGLNGLDGQYFHRDYTHTSSWHTLYTGTDKLAELAEVKGIRKESDELIYKYNEQDTEIDGQPATEFTLPYAPFYRLTYEYNADSKLYERYINGAPHASQSGQTLSAKNVIVLYMDNYNLNDGTNTGRQELDNIGSGKGFYMTNGKYKEITWSKSSRLAKTVIKDESGTEIILNPGITYVQIIPASKGVTIE